MTGKSSKNTENVQKLQKIREIAGEKIRIVKSPWLFMGLEVFDRPASKENMQKGGKIWKIYGFEKAAFTGKDLAKFHFPVPREAYCGLPKSPKVGISPRLTAKQGKFLVFGNHHLKIYVQKYTV